MSKIDDQNHNSRRNFLKKVGFSIGAAGAVSSLGLLSACTGESLPEGEKVKVMTADGRLVEVDGQQLKVITKEELPKFQERGREGLAGKHFVMVIDLSRCQNARKCMEGCNAVHELHPYQHHINTLQMQDSASSAPYFMPKPCFHCDNPPCTKVCPVNATFKRRDGIVLIDNLRCIGCRFCIAACPYSARMFHWFDPAVAENGRIYDIEMNVPQKKGTITKCVFSADRVRKGELPYCVSACPNGVFYFGDKNEDAVTNGTTKETVKFSELIAENGGYTYFEELGTKPQVYYLPPKNRRTPYHPVPDTEGKTIQPPTNPTVKS